jgi:hypothetical protein
MFRMCAARIVRSASGFSGEAFAGLPADVRQMLSAARVTDKKLLELSVTWSGLPASEASIAEALRVFVLTWDPLETDAPRPDGFAAVNHGSLGLEIAVYVPIWRLIDVAAASGHRGRARQRRCCVRREWWCRAGAGPCGGERGWPARVGSLPGNSQLGGPARRVRMVPGAGWSASWPIGAAIPGSCVP